MVVLLTQPFEADSRWVSTSFPSRSVVFAVTVRNATNDDIKHVATYTHYGQVQYPQPRIRLTAYCFVLCLSLSQRL